MTPLHTSTATTTGGRTGHTKSDDGVIDLPVTMPKGLGGDGARGTNPEQLFAAGYSACFGSALGLVARMSQVNPGPFSITAAVAIGKEGPGFKLAVTLTGTFPELEKEKAMALMEKAHQVCPYSNATRGNIDVALNVA